MNTMRRLQIQRAKFSLELCLIFILWSRTSADKLHTVQSSAARDLTSPKTNKLHYVPNTEPDQNEVRNFSETESEQEEHRYDDRLPQSPFQRQSILPQEPAPFVTKLEYQRGSSNRHPNFVQHHHHQQQQQPITSVRRQQSEVHYQHNKKKFVPDANYHMKFGGKEKIYAEDSSTKEYRPPGHEYGDKFVERGANKKNNYEKSYRKYKYTYSSPNKGEPDSNTPDYEGEDGVKARPSNSPNGKNYPKYVHPSSPRATDDQTPPTMDFYTAKSTSWKQLGPNVEISTSAEHPVYSKRDSLSETTSKSATNKKRKGSPKNVRSGYLNQQHALYIANNLANFANFPLRPVKGMFDHNNVMKQSDKFELSDAMFQELEEAKKHDEAQIRTKQETSKEQYHKYQPELANGYHYQVNPALLNALPVEANAHAGGKYYQPHPVSAFSKGFIRHIEVETSPSGGKKMIPALIIPLTPDQLNNQFFNHDIGLYLNHPEVLNPTGKVRQGQPHPFETVNSRHLQQQHDPYSNISPADNYQYHQQILSPYEFRIPEEGYNPYVNYQSQNLYRLPYNFNGGPSTSASVDAKSPETRSVIYSAKKKHNHRVQSSPSPSPPSSLSQHQHQQQQEQQKIHVNRVSQAHPTENSKVNYMREEYVFDANKNENYLSASESYTTIASIKDKDQKMVEKIENKVN